MLVAVLMNDDGETFYSWTSSTATPWEVRSPANCLWHTEHWNFWEGANL